MVPAAEHLGLHVLLKTPRVPGVLYVQVQALHVVAEPAVDSGRHSAKRLIYHGFDKMAGIDRPFPAPVECTLWIQSLL